MRVKMQIFIFNAYFETRRDLPVTRKGKNNVASSSEACSRKNQPSHFRRQHDIITSRTGSCVKRRRNFNRPWHLA